VLEYDTETLLTVAARHKAPDANNTATAKPQNMRNLKSDLGMTEGMMIVLLDAGNPATSMDKQDCGL
jgi:hypothetical protein